MPAKKSTTKPKRRKPPSGGPPLGTKNAQKLKTPELKKEAYRQYCLWIAEGKSKKSFVFDHPELTITWQTMETYIKNDPVNFNPKQKEAAEGKSLEVWENRGLSMMLGQIERCQPAIFQMFMRNKFGWDKQDSNASSDSITMLSQLLEHWKK